MSYIGRNIDSINNISTLDNLSFNGSLQTFNLTQNSVAFVPVSADALQIQIDGVIQANNFTISGSTVTFDFTPNSGSVCNSIKHFGVGLLTTVSDGAITEAKIGSGAVTSSKIASGVIPTSRPNVSPIIINGDMAVAQRGTSFVSEGEQYTLDRFYYEKNNDAVVTITQEALTSGNAYKDGFSSALKVDVTTADTNFTTNQRAYIEHTIEGQDLQLVKKGTSDAEKLTLAFWVKATKTGTNVVRIDANDSGRVCSQSYTISSSDTWEKKVLNFPADTTGVINNDNGKGLRITWGMASGTNYTSGTLATTWEAETDANTFVGQVNNFDSTSNNFHITGIQLEVGEYTSSTLPPFQHESYGDNLARCQRYYYKIAAADGGYFGSGNIDGNNDAQIFVPFSVTMRTSPSAIETNGTASHYAIRTTFNTTCDVVPVFSNTDLDRAMVIFKKTNHGITNGAAALARSQNNTAYLAWSAEL